MTSEQSDIELIEDEEKAIRKGEIEGDDSDH